MAFAFSIPVLQSKGKKNKTPATTFPPSRIDDLLVLLRSRSHHNKQPETSRDNERIIPLKRHQSPVWNRGCSSLFPWFVARNQSPPALSGSPSSIHRARTDSRREETIQAQRLFFVPLNVSESHPYPLRPANHGARSLGRCACQHSLDPSISPGCLLVHHRL